MQRLSDWHRCTHVHANKYKGMYTQKHTETQRNVPQAKTFLHNSLGGRKCCRLNPTPEGGVAFQKKPDCDPPNIWARTLSGGSKHQEKHDIQEQSSQMNARNLWHPAQRGSGKKRMGWGKPQAATTTRCLQRRSPQRGATARRITTHLAARPASPAVLGRGGCGLAL